MFYTTPLIRSIFVFFHYNDILLLSWTLELSIRISLANESKKKKNNKKKKIYVKILLKPRLTDVWFDTPEFVANVNENSSSTNGENKRLLVLVYSKTALHFSRHFPFQGVFPSSLIVYFCLFLGKKQKQTSRSILSAQISVKFWH